MSYIISLRPAWIADETLAKKHWLLLQRLSSQHPHCDSQPPVTLAPGNPVPSDLHGHQAHAGNSHACRQTHTHKQKGTLRKSAPVTNTELTEGMLTEPSWPGRPVFIPTRDFLRATLACGWVPQAREVWNGTLGACSSPPLPP